MVPVELPQGFSIVFCRFLDGHKTVPILQNVMKSETNKRDIMGYNEHWSFSMEICSKSSKSHQLQTFNCLLTGLGSIMYQFIFNIFNLIDMFPSIISGC